MGRFTIWSILTILIPILLSNLAFFATFWVQYHIGTVQMDRVGNVEGLVMVSLTYAGYAIFGVEWLTYTEIVWSLALA